MIFETSVIVKYNTRGTTQIAEKLPLLESINPYAFTQQSRRDSTELSSFFLSAQKLQVLNFHLWLAPTVTSLQGKNL